MPKLTFRGGIHPQGNKEMTQDKKIVDSVKAEKVYLPLIQSIGASCATLVEVGDTVKKGQKIADAQGFVSAPVHASVSGEVVAIEEMPIPSGAFVQSIVIQNDGKDEWHESIKAQQQPGNIAPKELREIVREAGIVGLGGAAFPTHVKYAIPDDKKVNRVIINGAECEPYLTADHRLMLEDPVSLMKGLGYIMKMVNCNEGIIAVEDNKMDAFQVLTEAAKDYPQVKIVACKTKYPQGSEKQLIKVCTGQELPFGKLPVDLGVVVNNVGTAVAICQAVEKGIPLTSRVVTVTGEGVKQPGNYLVPVGILISDLIEYCGGLEGQTAKIISGGPMMGKALYTASMPVIKGTSGILVLNNREAKKPAERNCVRCAKCVDACPQYLMPTNLVNLSKQKKWEEMEENKAMDCIECGSCAYVCPAHIPMVQYISRGKNEIKASKTKSTN